MGAIWAVNDNHYHSQRNVVVGVEHTGGLCQVGKIFHKFDAGPVSEFDPILKNGAGFRRLYLLVTNDTDFVTSILISSFYDLES